MTVAVAPTPTGPPTPTGGWSVAFADGFAVPIGTGPGQNYCWYPNSDNGEHPTVDHPGGNANETCVFNASQAQVDAEGLQLVGEPVAGLGGNKLFRTGIVTGSANKAPAAIKPFRWVPTEGKTMAFEIVCKLPQNTDEADPSFWSFGPLGGWRDEMDFFEAWGWGSGSTRTSGYTKAEVGNVWIYRTSEAGGTLQKNTSAILPFDPVAAFHTYTFVLFPDNSFSAYIDGVVRPSCNKVKPAEPSLIQRVQMSLSVEYAMREAGSGGSGFTSGKRKFTVRSVAVYEDTPHAGLNVENRGLAPGTTTGKVEPPPEEEHPPPSGLKVGMHLRSTQGSWSHNPTAYTYQWERCNASGGEATPIAGATGAHYQLVTADKGHTIRCLVTASNAFGSATQISVQTLVIE